MGFLSWLSATIADKRIAAFQNDLMRKHITEVENIYGQMRGWRHDYHSHIQKIKAHLQLEQYSEIEAYLDILDEDLTNVDTLIKSGNIPMDAILNSKISVALTKKINVNAKARVPSKLDVSEIDLCVIIGNLIDNAVEACMKLPDEQSRFIRVYVDIFKEQLYISVSNSAGEFKRRGSSYLSTKRAEGYGFGLKRIDKIAGKYGGFVNRKSEEGVFATEIMLPLRAIPFHIGIQTSC